MTSRAKDFDQYFTPPELAATLIQAVTVAHPIRVGDFAAGHGELLRAAENRWPATKCIALDIDPEVVLQLKTSHPTWRTRCCDFTDEAERTRAMLSRGRVLQMPVIVLNPPFSCRGGSSRRVPIAGQTTRCSPALAFIVDALKHLQSGGQLVAIVPHGVVQGEKDATARGLLRQYYGMEVVELFARSAFAKCTPRTAIIRLTAGLAPASVVVAESSQRPEANVLTASLLRGRQSNTLVLHSRKRNLLPFIHTTDLGQGLLHRTRKQIAPSDLPQAYGPAVLLPRVGKPTADKIVLFPAGAIAILSDCVFALECGSEQEAEQLQSLLISEWPKVEAAYGGTCARFISVEGLRKLLHGLGCYILPYGQRIQEFRVCAEPAEQMLSSVIV
ncbi:DNA methyltransferase family protein [Hymenobacter terricola]|uniref:methyltransferase n=1 Tax=Hymenobacter terricola TaxID=2819236 RepID=UPI001B315A41|nr:methyltransferase [Hymenobacter terricola]